MFFLSLITHNKCNSNCYYCDFIKNSTDLIEIDVDYVEYILNSLAVPLYLEISGGETGLISNMPQLLRKVIDNKYVNYFQVMSNGLFRDHYYDLVSCVKFRLYCEHLIQDIVDGAIQYNTQLPFVTEKCANILVLTDNVLNSLSPELMKYLPQNTVYKMLLNYTVQVKELNKYIKFYSDRQDKYAVSVLQHACDTNRILCSTYSHMPSITLYNKQINQCSFFKESESYAVTAENLRSLLRGTLFKYNKMCDACYYYDMDAHKTDKVVNARLNKSFINRDYGWFW
jgi:hypothetical protein